MMPEADSTHDECAARAQSFLRWGVAKLVKAPDFDSGIRGFESFLPSHKHQWFAVILLTANPHCGTLAGHFQ